MTTCYLSRVANAGLDLKKKKKAACMFWSSAPSRTPDSEDKIVYEFICLFVSLITVPFQRPGENICQSSMSSSVPLPSMPPTPPPSLPFCTTVLLLKATAVVVFLFFNLLVFLPPAFSLLLLLFSLISTCVR